MKCMEKKDIIFWSRFGRHGEMIFYKIYENDDRIKIKRYESE